MDIHSIYIDYLKYKNDKNAEERNDGKFHASWTKLNGYLQFHPRYIPEGELTEQPQCMPDYCKDEEDVVVASVLVVVTTCKILPVAIAPGKAVTAPKDALATLP